MSEQPESLIVQILREARAEIGKARAEIGEARVEVSEVRAESATKSDMHSLRADVASDMTALEKRLSEQIVGLRRAVMEYHSSTIGHGVLITELEERLRRVEQHLNLPPIKTH